MQHLSKQPSVFSVGFMSVAFIIVLSVIKQNVVILSALVTFRAQKLAAVADIQNNNTQHMVLC
jgi:hypothetical protein